MSVDLSVIKSAIGLTPYYEDSAGVIYCGDCLEILPKIPDIDMLKKSLTISTDSIILGIYEQARIQKEGNCRETVESPKGRDRVALQEPDVVSRKNRDLFWHISNGHGPSHAPIGYNIKRQRSARHTKWEIQGRFAKHFVSADDRERQMREMRCNRTAGNPSQEWKSSRQSSKEFASPLRELPQQPTQEVVVAIPQPTKFVNTPKTIEINPDYCRIAAERLSQEQLL